MDIFKGIYKDTYSGIRREETLILTEADAYALDKKGRGQVSRAYVLWCTTQSQYTL